VKFYETINDVRYRIIALMRTNIAVIPLSLWLDNKIVAIVAPGIENDHSDRFFIIP
jgi:hypothetical protein